MNRIETFKQYLKEKRAVKIIAGIDNFDLANIKKVVMAAQNSGASAVDICADEEIIREVRGMTDMPIFVSSIMPEELVRAVELGVDAIELGNFDALYKKGMTFSAHDVIESVVKTYELLNNREVFFSVTIPGELSVAEQIKLARRLEKMGVNLIQTEGQFTSEQSEGVRGLMARAALTIANTVELSRNVEIPIMTASSINPTTAAFAFAAGASAIGAGSCVNKADSEISMMATCRNLVEIASANMQKVAQLV